MARSSILFGAAASPAGTASNSAAVGWAPFGTSSVASGWAIWDAVSGGRMLFYGSLAAASNLSASSVSFAAGAVIITSP